MELLALIGSAILVGGALVTTIATWCNFSEIYRVDRELRRLDLARYEWEKRVADLEEWRNS
jgi:hypothetical protein